MDVRDLQLGLLSSLGSSKLCHCPMIWPSQRSLTSIPTSVDMARDHQSSVEAQRMARRTSLFPSVVSLSNDDLLSRSIFSCSRQKQRWSKNLPVTDHLIYSSTWTGKCGHGAVDHGCSTDSIHCILQISLLQCQLKVLSPSA